MLLFEILSLTWSTLEGLCGMSLWNWVLRLLQYLHKVLTRYIIVTDDKYMLEQLCLSIWYCNLEEKNYILVNQFVEILHCFEHQKRMFVKCSTLGIFNGLFLLYLLQDYSTQRILSQLTKWYPTIPIVTAKIHQL